MRVKEYTVREFEKILKDNGYRLDRSKGDHNIYVNDENGKTISVKSTKVNKMIALRLIKENNLIVNE